MQQLTMVLVALMDAHAHLALTPMRMSIAMRITIGNGRSAQIVLPANMHTEEEICMCTTPLVIAHIAVLKKAHPAHTHLRTILGQGVRTMSIVRPATSIWGLVQVMAPTLTAHGNITTVPAIVDTLRVMIVAKVRTPMSTTLQRQNIRNTVRRSTNMENTAPLVAAMSALYPMRITAFPTVPGRSTVLHSTIETQAALVGIAVKITRITQITTAMDIVTRVRI